MPATVGTSGHTPASFILLIPQKIPRIAAAITSTEMVRSARMNGLCSLLGSKLRPQVGQNCESLRHEVPHERQSMELGWRVDGFNCWWGKLSLIDNISGRAGL